jgi:hypothetical protein
MEPALSFRRGMESTGGTAPRRLDVALSLLKLERASTIHHSKAEAINA